MIQIILKEIDEQTVKKKIEIFIKNLGLIGVVKTV